MSRIEEIDPTAFEGLEKDCPFRGRALGRGLELVRELTNTCGLSRVACGAHRNHRIINQEGY